MGKKPTVEQPALIVDLSKHKRVTGADREQIGAEMRAQYGRGASIRELAEAHGRSFGWVNNVLRDVGATIRPRGGARVRA